MAFSIVVWLTVAIGAVFGHVLYRCYFHPLAGYPGPWLARFTNVRRLTTFLSGRHHLDELGLHHRYGRIVRVGPNWLSFSNLSDFEAIYGFNHHIEKGEFYDFGRDRARGIYNIFTAHTENQHREKRKKVFSPALTATKVATYGDVVRRHGSNLVSRLESLRRRSSDGEDDNGNDSDNRQAVNIARTVHRYTIDTLLEVIYGPIVCPVPFTDIPAASGFPETIQSAGKMAWTASLLPTLGWLMSTSPMMAWTRRVMLNAEGQPTNISAITVASATLIYTQQERISQCQQSSILKHWTDLPSEDSRKMSPPELWNEAFNLTFAGHGSSAGALTALLYRLGLGAGKSWQEKIRTEVKAAGHVMGVPLASTFPILFAAIKETLRLDAPFSTAFPRTIRVGAETAIPNLPTALPAGTVVSANTFTLGRSRAIWGDDAEEWKPQRWLEPSSEEEKIKQDERFVAFSKGSRQCAGKDLAMLIIAAAVSTVIQKWEISSVGKLKGNSFLEMVYDECWMRFEDHGVD